MTIAHTVTDFLQKQHVAYDVVSHPHTDSSKGTARAAHVPADCLAKAVVLTDAKGYLMAVVPGDCHVDLHTLSRKLGRRLELVSENRLPPVFKDCDPGAVPPLGPAYGMETIMDDRLVGQPQIYFEAGDHQQLIRVSGEQFVSLLKEARHGRFCH